MEEVGKWNKTQTFPLAPAIKNLNLTPNYTQTLAGGRSQITWKNVEVSGRLAMI